MQRIKVSKNKMNKIYMNKYIGEKFTKIRSNNMNKKDNKVNDNP